MAHTQHSYTPIIHTKRIQQGHEPRVTLEELESNLMNAGYDYQAGEVRAPNGLPYIHVYAAKGTERIWIGSRNALLAIPRQQLHLLFKLRLADAPISSR